jgi:Flp pilus assembly protein TadD
MTKLLLNLAGPVRFVSPDGRDLTPSSMKARGLLALIGVSAGLKVGRAKLQDKLWSERSPEQGSASLRQVLSEIRRALGLYRSALTSGPGWIGLDGDQVEVGLDPRAPHDSADVEFAADLDIHDPEFEDWLRLQRQHFLDHTSRKGIAATASGQLSTSLTFDQDVLILPPIRTGRADHDGYVDLVLRDAAARAADIRHFAIYTTTRAEADFPHAITLLAESVTAQDTMTLNLTLVHAASGRQVMSRTFSARPGNHPDGMRSISSDVTLMILRAMSQRPSGPSLLNDVFGYSHQRLLAADAALAHNPDHPNHLALRAYIRNTLLLERFAENPDETRAEATEMTMRAIELAPQSATVLSVASMIAMRNRRFELSADLAERATRIDATNPFAKHSLSASLSFLGQHQAAHDEAMRLVREPLRELSPASWPMACAVTATRLGRFDEALRYARLAHDYAPLYRPPLRFLSALQFHLGNELEAAAALEKLRQIEPDFSLELMASKSYPVATLRETRLLGVAESSLV